jgi:hypothetical protein
VFIGDVDADRKHPSAPTSRPVTHSTWRT